MPKAPQNKEEQTKDDGQQEQGQEQNEEQAKDSKTIKSESDDKVRVRKFKLLRGIHRQKNVKTGEVETFRPGDVFEAAYDLAQKHGAEKFSPV